MSAEVVPKKRGRPRKVVPVEGDGEVVAKEVKTKSKTPKTTRTRKVKTPTTTDSETTNIPLSTNPDIEESIQALPKATSTSSSPSEAQIVRTKSTVTPKTSKILEQVRELSTQAAAQAPAKPKATKNTPISTTPKTAKTTSSSPPPPSEAVTSKSSSPSPAQPIIPPTSSPKSSPQSTTLPLTSNTTKPKVPLAAFNSAIVSNISERAGARPNSAGSKALPKNYQNTARKVTMTIVALPIAIVTSYVLYQRLVLGEQKQLLSAPPQSVETPPTLISVTRNE